MESSRIGNKQLQMGVKPGRVGKQMDRQGKARLVGVGEGAEGGVNVPP